MELIYLLEQIVERDPSFQLLRSSRAESRMRADLTLENNGRILFVEVKIITPQTTSRLSDVLAQLRNFRGSFTREFPGREVRGVLAISGVLASDKVQMVQAEGFDLWDRRWMIAHAERVGLEGAIPQFLGGRKLLDEAVPEEAEPDQGELLQGRLRALQCGRPSWYAYQKLCGNILEYLFCPPLNTPIAESADKPRYNRRDFVIPNYVPDGFWQFMREHYRADYLVIDAKNYCGQANKTHVLQIANYLSTHKTGLFGIIVTRNGMDAGGIYTCREQWILHTKLIITLNDDDVLQMLESKKVGADPEDLVRQKIEDFRLGM